MSARTWCLSAGGYCGRSAAARQVGEATSDFSRDKIQTKLIRAGVERAPGFDLPVGADRSEWVLDLKGLNLPPGEFRVSLLGGGVAKVREAAQSRDIADIVVAEPFTIRIHPVEQKRWLPT